MREGCDSSFQLACRGPTLSRSALAGTNHAAEGEPSAHRGTSPGPISIHSRMPAPHRSPATCRGGKGGLGLHPAL